MAVGYGAGVNGWAGTGWAGTKLGLGPGTVCTGAPVTTGGRLLQQGLGGIVLMVEGGR